MYHAHLGKEVVRSAYRTEIESQAHDWTLQCIEAGRNVSGDYFLLVFPFLFSYALCLREQERLMGTYVLQCSIEDFLVNDLRYQSEIKRRRCRLSMIVLGQKDPSSYPVWISSSSR